MRKMQVLWRRQPKWRALAWSMMHIVGNAARSDDHWKSTDYVSRLPASRTCISDEERVRDDTAAWLVRVRNENLLRRRSRRGCIQSVGQRSTLEKTSRMFERKGHEQARQSRGSETRSTIRTIVATRAARKACVSRAPICCITY